LSETGVYLDIPPTSGRESTRDFGGWEISVIPRISMGISMGIYMIPNSIGMNDYGF
jgi:hypothetical protein